jgi:hypothetical protein
MEKAITYAKGHSGSASTSRRARCAHHLLAAAGRGRRSSLSQRRTRVARCDRRRVDAQLA